MVLEGPVGHLQVRPWTIQGLGMMRTYLSNGDRITIWHNDLIYPGVTRIHDHPWSFRSTVISGEMHDTRFDYARGTAVDFWRGAREYTRALITAGEGKPSYLETVWLEPRRTNVVSMGHSYKHDWNDVHLTGFANGTVTYCHRFDHQGPMAHVFWPVNEQYGSAEPRAATPEEVEKYTQAALEDWS